VRFQQRRSNTDGNSSSDGDAYRHTNSHVSAGHVDGGSDFNGNCCGYGDADQNRAAHSHQHHSADTDQHSAADSNRNAQRDRDVNADSERYAHGDRDVNADSERYAHGDADAVRDADGNSVAITDCDYDTASAIRRPPVGRGDSQRHSHRSPSPAGARSQSFPSLDCHVGRVGSV